MIVRRGPFLILNFIVSFSIYGQERLNFQLLNDKIDAEEPGTPSYNLYCNAYLQKARTEANWTELVNAYKCKLYQAKEAERVFYADSMVWAAKHTRNNNVIGGAFLTKGIVYYGLKDHSNALDNYLLANDYLAQTNDTYLHFKVKYNIAQIKYYLGFYEEAVALFRECVDYYKGRDTLPYLTSLHSLGQCYNRQGKYDLCSATNTAGIKSATTMGRFDAIPRFIHSEGINQYFKKNYKIAIAKLSETLPSIRKSKDFANESVTYFYLGKNFWALGQQEKAIPYFRKADSIFSEQTYIRPDMREGYELLIDYYKDKADFSSQLLYINQLVLADKFLEANYKYLSGRIHKEYDYGKLLNARKEVEKQLRHREQLDVVLALLIILLTVAVGYLSYRSWVNKRKFNLLMSQKKQREKVKGSPPDINPHVVELVLKSIEKFETSHKYLAKDLTLPRLAKLFDSNTVYVSKIILYYKQKKSIDYINDLKVDYLIEQLKTNRKFRNYTNKALSEEVGFNSTQHFTRAFIKKTGISPGYFIKELNKSEVQTK